jgi:hypothetical protein
MTDPTFITLGPEGTCHEHAMLRYLEFQGLESAKVHLVDDLLDGVDLVHEEPNSFLVQCSAHPDVHHATERYPQEVFVVDTFIYPAKEMALLVRTDVESPKTMAVVPAAAGYTDLTKWETVVEGRANPLVARDLLSGKYDAGITFAAVGEQHPDRFRIAERYGEVDTTWVVFGKRRRYRGEVIGHSIPWLFTGAAEPVATPELEPAGG